MPDPNAPTNLSPADGSTVFTLSPALAGTHDDPDGDYLRLVTIEVRRVSDDALFWSTTHDYGIGSTQTAFSITYAGTALVSKTQYKWRAQTYSVNQPNTPGPWSSWQAFTPVITTAPTATVVSPTGNPVVGTLTPTLTFSYSDPESDAQGAYQIQVRRFSDQQSFWDTGQVLGAATSVVYAGTTLVTGTQYEWRVRVADEWGLWSAYTAWASFTPSAAPNPPSGITPSGLQNTLTPTVSGTYNQGLGDTEAAYQYEVRQGTITIYSSGDVAGAFATGQAYGTNNPSDSPSSPPALQWGTSYSIRARSKDSLGSYSEWSSWQAFNTNGAPTTPTSLSPSGAVVGDTTPTLSWRHNDPEGDAQTQVEIELRKVSDNSLVTGYGPKTLTQSAQSHDVTETLTNSPATEYKWRIRTKGLAGPGFGPWSSFVTFTVAPAPTITVNEPDADDVVTTPGLTVEWAFSGGSGTQQSYRVKVYGDDQSTVVYDSGTVAGTATSHLVPAGNLDNGETYYVQVIATDTLAQEGQSTKVPFTTDWTPPAPLTGVQVVAVGGQA